MKNKFRSKIFLSFLVAFNFFISSYIPINATENGTNVVFDYEAEECPENSICTYRYNHNLKVYMLAAINEEDEYIKDILADVPSTDEGGGGGNTWEIEVYNNQSIVGSGTYPSDNTITATRFTEVLLMKETSISKGKLVDYDISLQIRNVSNTSGGFTNIFNYATEVSVNGVLLEEFTVDSTGIANLKGTAEMNNSDGTFMIYIKFSSKAGSCNVNLITVNSFVEDERTATDIRLDNINGMISSLISGIGNLLNAILNLPSLIFEQFTGILSSIWTAITNLGDTIMTALESLGNFIVNAINKIQQWLTDLLNGIIQGLKDLFIPSNQYFTNYFDSLYYFFNEKLGILLLPFDILISLMNNILNLGNGDGYIHVPKFEYMDITLIPKIDYNLKEDVQQVLGNYYDLYYMLTDVIIYFLLFNMAKKKFENIVGGNSQ